MTTVMVVDDEKVIADSLAAILRISGYMVTAFYDGQSALQACIAAPPDIVITDVSMPGLNGVEMAIQIRSNYPRCKILLFSGHAATAGILDSARQRGYSFDLLAKPVHPRDLLAALSGQAPPVPQPEAQSADRESQVA